MNNHISGQDFDVMIGGLLVRVESLSATITDNRKAVQTKGVPDGYVNGDVSCTGEIEVDTRNFMIIAEAARLAGSYRDLDPFDVTCVANAGLEIMTQELFDCLFTITDLLNIDPKGSEKSKHKLGFEVTSPDFVRINGVPYLSDRDTLGI